MNIFQEFRVPIPTLSEMKGETKGETKEGTEKKEKKKWNILSVDYGDGEVSASVLRYAIDDMSGDYAWKVLRLTFNPEGGSLLKLPNAISVPMERGDGSKKPSLIIDIEQDTGEDHCNCYNFKNAPNSPKAKEKYRLDNGTLIDYTRAELMAIGFAIVVEVLFNANREYLNPEYNTIIVVGCPSSDEWKRQKKEYAELLKSKLDGIEIKSDDGRTSTHLNKEKIYMMIQTESTAVLAKDASNILADEIVVVLDNGSSTFDATVCTGEGIPAADGEDSYTFGGNNLDECLLQDCMSGFDKFCQEQIAEGDEPPAVPDDLKLKLRMGKEKYYGRKGTSNQIQVVECGDYLYYLNKKSMKHVLNEIPFELKRPEVEIGSVRIPRVAQRASWLENCRSVYQAFYDKMKHHFAEYDEAGKPIPHRVLLSGGVSVMPEVRALVREVFGVEPDFTFEPNYSVSQGMAYLIKTEIMKKNIIEEVKKEVEPKIPSMKSLKETIVEENVADIWNQCLVPATREWAEGKNISRSMADWYACYERYWSTNPDGKRDRDGNRYYNWAVKSGAERWYREKGINTIIATSLKNHFCVLFPNHKKDYVFQLSNPTVEAFHDTIWCHRSSRFFFADVGRTAGMSEAEKDAYLAEYDETNTTPRSYQERQAMLNTLLSREAKIKKGGELKGSYTAYIEEGLWLWKKDVPYSREYTLKFDGWTHDYEKGFPDSVMEKYREEIMGIVYSTIEKHADAITPYLQMTAAR